MRQFPAAVLAVGLLVGLCGSAPAGPVTADYRDDYHVGTTAGQDAVFGDGWSYLWNPPSGWDGSAAPDGSGSTGAVGTMANYAPLKWTANTGYGWSVDGDTDNNNGLPGRYERLNATGGHPGRGSTQPETPVANTLDRYAIAAYTIQPGQGGHYVLLDTVVDPVDGAGNGGDVVVHVNDNAPVLQKNFDNSYTTFGTYLGGLSAGDTVHVGLGPANNDGSDSFNWDFSLQKIPAAEARITVENVASYRGDFQGSTFPSGWAYQVNDLGSIGTAANYSNLQWTGSIWDNDGTPGLPGAAPGMWVNLTATGGHPGPGASQGDSGGIERYAIAAYTVPSDGMYAITDSFVDPLETQGNGGDVMVFVNDGAPLLQRYFDDSYTTFDQYLGDLQQGDTIYVALGPNVQDGYDSFSWDFTVTRYGVPEPATLALAALGLAGLGGYVRRRRKA